MFFFVLVKEADEIRKSAETTKSEAGKLRDEADVLAGRVAVTSTKVEELENQSKKDQELTDLVRYYFSCYSKWLVIQNSLIRLPDKDAKTVI